MKDLVGPTLSDGEKKLGCKRDEDRPLVTIGRPVDEPDDGGLRG